MRVRTLPTPPLHQMFHAHRAVRPRAPSATSISGACQSLAPMNTSSDALAHTFATLKEACQAEVASLAPPSSLYLIQLALASTGAACYVTVHYLSILIINYFLNYFM